MPKTFVKIIISLLPFVIMYFGLVFYFETEKNSGKEFVLKVVSYDPNDLMRGDFVNLRYDINRIESEVKPENMYSYTDYCVLLSDSIPSKSINVVTKDKKYGENFICGSGNFMERYNIENSTSTKKGEYNLSFDNIQKYFVQVGTGRYMDSAARESRLESVISVSKSGRAYLKYLKMDGQQIDFANIESQYNRGKKS